MVDGSMHYFAARKSHQTGLLSADKLETLKIGALIFIGAFDWIVMKYCASYVPYFLCIMPG